MSENMTSTATTREAQIVGPANVVYQTTPPRGQVYRVTPHAPTPRS